MSITTTLPANPTDRRATIAAVGALVAVAIALLILVAAGGSSDAPPMGRTSSASVGHIGTADATERRTSLVDVYRGDGRRVGSADAGERWSGR